MFLTYLLLVIPLQICNKWAIRDSAKYSFSLFFKLSVTWRVYVQAGLVPQRNIAILMDLFLLYQGHPAECRASGLLT
jgi:hypothetical protein